jgi:hypothetical protein
VTVAAVALLSVGGLLPGCGNGKSKAAAPTVETSSPETFPTSVETTVDPTSTSASGGQATSTTAKTAATIAAPAGPDNPLFPLKPGFQSVREGGVNKGNRRLSHRLVFTVTDVRKEIDGVQTIAALDQDFDGGELAEESLDWFAVDPQGNVLYLGSYTETYEGGRYVNATDAWLGGVKGAKAGMLLPGAPKAGTPTYTQAVVPGEGAATAKVVKTGERKCVPFKCFNDVVVIEEDGAEHKYFAPGAGGILTEPLSGNPQETEELINVTQLSAQGLAELSAEAVKLDQHARTVAKDVYGTSAAAKRAS